GVLLHERQDVVRPATGLLWPRPLARHTEPRPAPTSRWDGLVDIGTAVNGQPHLLEVVLAGGPIGRLADLLHRRNQQRDQDGDDGDHHEQLDEREPDKPAGELTRRTRAAKRKDHGGTSRVRECSLNQGAPFRDTNPKRKRGPRLRVGLVSQDEARSY